jgi:hypothetical protein
VTLGALERKLTARYLVEKGFDMFRDSLNTSEAVNRSLDIVRANPVPLTLIGIGAAWLIASQSGVVDRIARDERIAAARRRVADMATSVMPGDGQDRALGETGNPIVDESGGGRGSGWVHQVSDMAQGALRSARDSGGAILGRAGGYAGDGAGRIADQIGDVFDRHPLLMGGIGVMAGALAAALLPLTRTEEELIGDTRDQLWNKAQQTGRDAVSRVREAASQAAAKAVDAAADAAAETVRSEMHLNKPSQG